jgi:hypothetical protein
MDANPSSPTPSADAPDPDAVTTTDELVANADDPASDKQKTGSAQAAENRELDPPA